MVSVHELAVFCSNKGANAHGMHIGGSHVFDGVKIKLTPAWHGSGYGEECPLEYLGTPCGFIFKLDGKTIYHSGDTGLFGDMELIGRLNRIDLAMIPIGDNYNGSGDALEAVKMLAGPGHTHALQHLPANRTGSFKIQIRSRVKYHK